MLLVESPAAYSSGTWITPMRDLFSSSSWDFSGLVSMSANSSWERTGSISMFFNLYC